MVGYLLGPTLRAPYSAKNMTRNGQNSRPAETDPYVYVCICTCICAVIQKVTQQRETRDLFRKSPNFQGAKLLPLLRLVQNTRRHLHH